MVDVFDTDQDYLEHWRWLSCPGLQKFGLSIKFVLSSNFFPDCPKTPKQTHFTSMALCDIDVDIIQEDNI